MQYLAKRSAKVGYVAIHGVELGMVPNVKDVTSEFHLPSLSEPGLFGKTHIPVVDTRTAADRAWRAADSSRRNRVIRKQTRIEHEPSILPNVLGVEWSSEIRLTRCLEVECGVEQFHIVLGGDATVGPR